MAQKYAQFCLHAKMCNSNYRRPFTQTLLQNLFVAYNEDDIVVIKRHAQRTA